MVIHSCCGGVRCDAMRFDMMRCDANLLGFEITLLYLDEFRIRSFG